MPVESKYKRFERGENHLIFKVKKKKIIKKIQ